MSDFGVEGNGPLSGASEARGAFEDGRAGTIEMLWSEDDLHERGDQVPRVWSRWSRVGGERGELQQTKPHSYKTHWAN